jgi:hypothetical protein
MIVSPVMLMMPRVYSIALSDDDITKIYNNQGGDMGLVADFTCTKYYG